MADIVPKEGPGPGGSLGTFVGKLSKQRIGALAGIRRRRRILAAIGAAAVEPIQQTTTPRVGMLHDQWKQSVRVATVSTGTLATSFESGDTIDGVVLATGDRILLKNQSTAHENGIYVVSPSGAPTRAADAAIGSHLVHAVVGVEQGTVNGDDHFVCYNNHPVVLGSTALTFATLSNFIGIIDGSLIGDGTMSISKLLGSGLSAGTIMYSDGSSWVTLDPPGVKSKLTHNGGEGAPYWEAV